ncbi:GLPGLI family protein [Pedobacter sp. Leaf250]|uniref:GLPGLI family protein n=1 Tax=Pedobacter sp. Leaf250 TaxID=2876559 RepID=UPI001E526C0D|nr:GLPGLI family protein [Pedobacter sp. Leaf250]
MNSYLKFILPLLFLGALFSFKYKDTSPKDSPSTIAYYHFYHIKDSTQTGKLYSEDFILAFNGKKSIYSSQTRVKQDSTIQAILAAAEAKNSDVVDMGTYLPVTEDDIYNENGKLFIVKNTLQQRYLITENPDKIDWKIDSETKDLLGYTCQKATGVCKGRKYTAWFTTDIPASFGPWKLNGLPGLVLEAYDDRHFIKFTCTKVVNQGNFQNVKSINIPQDVIKTTSKEYEQMKNAQANGFDMGSFDTGIIVDKVTSVGGNPGPKRKFTVNYPLELTD